MKTDNKTSFANSLINGLKELDSMTFTSSFTTLQGTTFRCNVLKENAMETLTERANTLYNTPTFSRKINDGYRTQTLIKALSNNLQLLAILVNIKNVLIEDGIFTGKSDDRYMKTLCSIVCEIKKDTKIPNIRSGRNYNPSLMIDKVIYQFDYILYTILPIMPLSIINKINN